MNAEMPSTEQQGHYRVVQDDYCVCNTCHQNTANWTIVSGAGEAECGVGQSWGDKEIADDICDLMNMAFDAGKEDSERAETEARKERLAERWS